MLASFRSPCRPRSGRVARAVSSELGSASRLSTSSVAAGGATRRKAAQPSRKRSTHRIARGGVRGGRPGRQESQPGVERAPRWLRCALALERRGQRLAPRQRVQAGHPTDDAVERARIDDRVVIRPLPRDELGREVGMRMATPSPSVAAPRYGKRRRRQPGERRAGQGRDPALAKLGVVGGAGDPVDGERGALQDEATAARVLEAGERGAGPAVGRERPLQRELQVVGAEQLVERLVAPALRHRHGQPRLSMAPGRRRRRRVRHPGRPRASRGSCGSGRRRAALPSRRSPRRGSRRRGCR